MYRKFGKRMLDILVAGGALLALSPVLILLAFGAKLSSPGPAIFRQDRVGRNGDLFQFYKFRSMPANTANVPSDQLGQIEIRPFGKFLRRSNLDELPQLFNVVRGDMSLVGPRPPIPTQTVLIGLRHDNGAIDCRPGLTGLAQINSFDGMTIAEKAALDGRYAQDITALGDVMIIIRTFGYLTRPPPTY